MIKLIGYTFLYALSVIFTSAIMSKTILSFIISIIASSLCILATALIYKQLQSLKISKRISVLITSTIIGTLTILTFFSTTYHYILRDTLLLLAMIVTGDPL
jgi:hypothetical protein